MANHNPPTNGLDKRKTAINRKGRPKAFDALRVLTQAIVTEPARDAAGKPIIIDGHAATNVEMIIRQWMRDPKRQQALLEIAYGKVPLPIQHTGDDGGPIKVENVILTDDERITELNKILDAARARQDGQSPLSAGRPAHEDTD